MVGGKSKTVKELNVEMDKLISEVETLKNVIETTNIEMCLKIKQLEDRIKGKSLESNDVVINDICCKKCDKSFETMKELKSHKRNTHQAKYICTHCDVEFRHLNEMEKHKISTHGQTDKHKCESCEMEFISEIRLRNHINSHKYATKYCHFFNNGKECIYEELGCKFRHEKSEMCKFRDKCKKLLCGYRHTETMINLVQPNVDTETNSEDSEDEVNQEIINSEDFNSDEYEESKEVVCDQYCDQIYGYHQHYDSDYKQYFGVDTPNIRERIIPVTKEHSFAYPCKMCEVFSTNLDDHQEHMNKIHVDIERTLSCMIDKCEYKTHSPEKLTRHIAVKHNDFIKERIKEWQQ